LHPADPGQGGTAPARGRARGPVRAPGRPYPDQARRRAGTDPARVRQGARRGGGRTIQAGRLLLTYARRLQRPRVSRPLFLVPSLDITVLDGPEGHHAADVMRLRVGEELLLGDGQAGLAEVVVTAVGQARPQV